MTDLRSRLADARLYLCTDSRRSSGDLAPFLDAVLGGGVDYFCAGPVWPTPTKAGRPGTRTGLVSHVAALGTARPWFAIGGISDLGRLDAVLAAGATRVVVRAITEAADPGAAATAIAKRLRSG